MFKKENVKYLGNKEVQISEDEIKECRFYIVNTEEITIGCSDYFIIDNRKRYSEELTLKKSNNINIVTFDEELIINDEIIKFRKKILEEEVLEEFLYNLALYHIENNNSKSGEVVLANTKDINAYISFINSEESFDRDTEIENLKKLIEDKSNRFKNGKTPIKFSTKSVEPRCLIEILNDIMEDDSSKLLWRYSENYKRVGVKKNPIDSKLVFNRFKETYGEVSGINIGSKKLNIGVKVKVLGQVENLRNNLKLDACIYREYNLISNCKVNSDIIYCTLSKELKSKLSKEKLIKIVSNSRYEKQQVYAIDINKVSISSKRILNILSESEIAKYLYDIEVLGCKSSLISKKIKDLIDSNKLKFSECRSSLSKEQIDIRKDFRVNYQGIYTPEYVEEDKEVEVYVADILQWGIVRFPRKSVENSIKVDISKILQEDINIAYKKLVKELEDIKEIKKLKENLINAIKISSYIFNIDIFQWDNEEYKKKTRFDKKINANAIIAERVKINTKSINNITVKQEYYKVIVKTALKE